MTERDLQHEIEQFLFFEATLIDHRQLDEWLGLFSDDAIYCAPNASEESDPTREGFIIYEDHRGLDERVRRLQHPAALTQVPPPRSRHMIANVVVTESADGVAVSSNQVVYFARQGAEAQYAGSWEHLLVRDGERWKIKRKKIYLLMNDRPMSQLPVL